MPRACCERSALSARSPASATRTWSSTERRSRCRRTSWQRPVRTSGEEGAGRGRVAQSLGAERAGRGTGVPVPTPQLPESPWSPFSAGSLPSDIPAGPHDSCCGFAHLQTRPLTGPPRPPELTPDPGHSPPPSLRFSQPGARRGLRAPEASRFPQTQSWAGRGDLHPRAGRGRSWEEPSPPPGPVRGSRLKFAAARLQTDA